MIPVINGPARLILFVCLITALSDTKCLASIKLNLTEAHIDQRYPYGPFDITLRGSRGDDGLPFVLEFPANENVNRPSGFWEPGASISPTFSASGLDLRSINTTGSINISGPALTLPTPCVSQTISGSVTFQINLPIYEAPFPMFGDPEYLLVATGTGVVDILLTAYVDRGPPYYEVADLSYSLVRTACVEGEHGAIPEPSTLVVWSVLGVAIAGLNYSCRRHSQFPAP